MCSGLRGCKDCLELAWSKRSDLEKEMCVQPSMTLKNRHFKAKNVEGAKRVASREYTLIEAISYGVRTVIPMQ